MKIIEVIKSNGGNRKRVALHFRDERQPLLIEVDTLLKMGLAAGGVLTDETLAELNRVDLFYRARNAALTFLGYRPRSEAEVRARLARIGFGGTVVDAVVGSLKEQNLIDDAGFAAFWTENRQTVAPQSRYLTRLELRRKGVAEAVIDERLGDLDDTENAYRAARTRAARLGTADKKIFQKRLGDYLRRRGFDFDVINETVARVWRELIEEAAQRV